MPEFVFPGWCDIPYVSGRSLRKCIWRIGCVVGKIKDGTERHVVGIGARTGYSMVNASSIHFMNSTLNYDPEK